MTAYKPIIYIALFMISSLPLKEIVFDKEKEQMNEGKYIKTELYFGLSKPDGSSISEAEFDAFADSVISKVFIKGTTILDSDGMWLQGGKLVKEDSRVVMYLSRVYEMTDEFSDKIDVIREKYKLYFNQDAVLRTDEYISASF